MNAKLNILVVVPRYLPGYKGGGPIRSIANLVSWLGEEFAFQIITSDRDSNEENRYPDIEVNSWQSVQKAKVLYLSPDNLGMFNWWQYLNNIDYDLLYLNGFFSSFTISILALRRMGCLSEKPVLLAPRGEFSPGALRLKSIKKRLYIWFTKQLKFYEGVYWQASSQYEKADILRVMGTSVIDPTKIKIATNLAPKVLTNSHVRPVKHKGSLRVVFLSRIVPKKNLDYAILQLARIKKPIQFDIYGPIEDRDYWATCQYLIEKTPSNVQINYCHEVRPEDVGEVFSRYHLFIFPTQGENFGHVILESLRSGCPVLISDETPWQDLENEKAGYIVSLSDEHAFMATINKFIEMDQEDFRIWSAGARGLGQRYAKDPQVFEANRRLFLDIIDIENG